MLKAFFFFCVVVVIGLPARSQPPHYDLKKKRLLIQTSGIYIYGVNQGAIDRDSANILACHAEHLPYTLSYDEDYDQGAVLPGQAFLEAERPDRAAVLLDRLRGKDRYLLLLQLGAWYVHRAGNAPDDMANAARYLEQARTAGAGIPDFRLWLATYELIGEYAAQVNDTSLREHSFAMTIDSCRKRKDRFLLAASLNHEAGSLSDFDPLKMPLLRECLSIYRELNRPEKQLEVLGRINAALFAVGKMDEVRQNIEQQLALQTGIGFVHQHYNYNVLAYLDLVKPRYADAGREADTAVEIMLATGDTALAPYFYLMQAQLYSIKEWRDKAVDIFYKIYSSYHEGPILWYHLFFNTVSILISSHHDQQALDLVQEVSKKYPPQKDLDQMEVYRLMGTAYEHLGQKEKALPCWTSMAALADKIRLPGADKDIGLALATRAYWDLVDGRRDKAEYYLARATMYPQEKMPMLAKSYIMETQYKLDSLNGNFGKALSIYIRYKTITDSLGSQQILHEFNELNIKYETEKKEHDIQLLNQKAITQQAELDKDAHIRTITFVSIGVLLVITLLIYNQYRLNRKINKHIREKNDALARLVTEKEWLVKEIHHRVKNNLHIITSLLESQSTYVEKEALSAIKDSQHRVQAMSLIHQKLYGDDNLAKIDMAVYITELVSYLDDSFNLNDRIAFLLNVEPVALGLSQAVPLGLILNEAITNAIKYAFPDCAEGKIEVMLQREATSGAIFLTVADNGIGLPAGFRYESAGTLGMKLIRGLSLDINAQLTVEGLAGTKIVLVFKVEGGV